MADNEIIVEITGRLDGIEKSLKSLETTAQKTGTAMGAGIVAGITASVTTAGLKALTNLGQTISRTFDKSIEEASQAGKALQLFNSSLAAAGNFSKAASKDFTDFAGSIQKVTGVSDDLIVSNASILASLGRLSGDGLERATKAAVNLAATGRVSLEGAFDAIAKSAAGSESALSRYGIKVDESIPKNERFGAILGVLESRFGDLAKAQLNTFAGVEAFTGAGFNEVLENLGKLVTNSPVVIAVMKEIGNQFFKFADAIKEATGGDILGGLIKQLLSFSQVIVDLVIKPLEVLFNIGVAGFQALRLGVQGTLVALAEIPTLVFQAIGKIIELSSVVGKLAGFFDKDLGESISNGLANAGQGLQNFSSNVRTTLEENFNEFNEKTAGAIGGIFDTQASTGIQSFITQMEDAAARAVPVGEGIKNSIGGAFVQVSEEAQRAAEKINKTFQQGVLNVISVGAQAIGASLIKGGKAFDNFKNQVLAIIGDMAIQIGTTLLAIGLGIDALKTSLGTLSGGFAIAAGLALIAIGGLLKSLSAGGASGEGTGVGGGVGAGPGGPAVGGGAFGSEPDLVAAQQGTKVNVNIAGNVLDRRETGLEIANVIQEHFNNNGTIIAGAT